MSTKVSENEVRKLREMYVSLNNDIEQETIIRKLRSNLGETAYSLIFRKGGWEVFSFAGKQWSLISRTEGIDLIRQHHDKSLSYNEFINLINEIADGDSI